MFHILQDLNDKSKTYALVDEIFQQKIDLKGLKRGDKVIAINEHILQDKTYKELQHIIHRLRPQQQIMLTIESRQWRQYGMFLHKGHLNMICIEQHYKAYDMCPAS